MVVAFSSAIVYKRKEWKYPKTGIVKIETNLAKKRSTQKVDQAVQ